MKNVFLTMVMVCLIAGVQADMAFTVDPSATWFGYINVWGLDNATYVTGFAETAISTASANWAPGPALPLTLSPNTRLYDENTADAYWVNQTTGAAEKIVEFNYYQEIVGTIGETVTLDWFDQAASITVPADYEVRAFIKVLDGGASWATTQYEYVDLDGTTGAGSLSFVVADAGVGTEVVQAGFSYRGVPVASTNPVASDFVTIGMSAATAATNPVPGNGEVVGSSLTELSWTNPSPINPSDTVTSDVYFLDAGLALWGSDPNMGPTVTDTGVVQIANDITAETVVLPGSVLPLQDDHYYYWAVHCTDPNSGGSITTQGDTWYFYTGDALPVVNAGPDQFNWVAKDDGDADPTTYTITVTGTYTDDGKSPIADANFVNLGWGWDPDGADDILGNADDQRGIEKISQTWTHNGTGGTDVPPAIVAHTAGTVTAVYKTHYVEGDPANSTDIPGYWDLQLQVTDGTGTGQDVVYVRVDADCGTATANDASDNFDGYYDTNNDCVVDLADFADFAAKWLDQSVKYE